MSGLRHLARRFAGSLSRRAPDPVDDAWAESMLLPGEVALWRRMGNVDRRHSVLVARRFVGAWSAGVVANRVDLTPPGEVKSTRSGPSREAIAAALLHDVGKVDSGLGTTMRVVATVVGPRGRRFRRYHEHEEIGLALAEAAGSAPATLELLRGAGPDAATLRTADDI